MKLAAIQAFHDEISHSTANVGEFFYAAALSQHDGSDSQSSKANPQLFQIVGLYE